jgi:hypothetical protein
MGILDDAIKEHLELKRAHGASEDELQQKEVEAFGPIRQEAAPAAEPDPEAGEVVEPETALYEDAAPEFDEAAAAEPGPEETAVHPAPAIEDAVHPGDHPVPDPHDHGHEGSDPPYREDAAVLQPPHHDEEPHPALRERDNLRGDEHPPEPVFPQQAETPAPAEPAPAEEPPSGDPPPEEEPPPAASTEEEDVLEETPEFLQDAPEHDRLWFEQKPPRDFDFGE